MISPVAAVQETCQQGSECLDLVPAEYEVVPDFIVADGIKIIVCWLFSSNGS
jgi:hypothetical protein